MHDHDEECYRAQLRKAARTLQGEMARQHHCDPSDRHIVAVVAETGSYRAAAVQLGRTSKAVMEALWGLAGRFGVRLPGGAAFHL